MIEDPKLKGRLGRLRRTELISCQIQNIPLVIARTGYTGESWGFEILVHPDQMGKLWNSILKYGEAFGLKPAGLACRDSTRIEAGLPLYGQELAGPLGISPMEAGFPGYVKYHKPYFIGREAMLGKESSLHREVIRFRCTQKRSRRPSHGDPVVNGKEERIGEVTSCSVGVDGCLVGLALIQKEEIEAGKLLTVQSLRGQSLQDNIQDKARVSTTIEIEIIPRFPEKTEPLPPWLLAGD